MLAAIRNLFKRPSLSRRSYDGAGSGRRWRGGPDQPSAQAAALASASVLARRARGLVSNNPLAASAVEGWTSALIGTGIRPVSRIPGIVDDFDRWTDYADADDHTDFYGMQASIMRSVIVNGESFVLLTDNGLRIIDCEQVDRSVTRELGKGARIVQGIEFDANGKRTGYHIRTDAPGAPFASYETARIPAGQVLHIFRPMFAGQVRGLSWFAPVLLRLSDHDKSIDAQLQRQLTSALFTGFIVDPNGSAGGFDPDGTARGSTIEPSLEPATMHVLRPGEDVRFSDPAAIGSEAIDFLRVTAREIASGLGLPAHVMDGDLSSANYSSLRAGLVEWKRRVEALQNSVVIYQLVRPVWRRFVLDRFLAGANMPGFEKDPERYLACKFVCPRFDMIDAQKEAEAEVMAINAGLMSRRDAVAGRGLDIEQLDAEIAADRAREQRLGLNFAGAALPPKRLEIAAP